MGVRPSMGSVGDAYGNAMAEEFLRDLGVRALEPAALQDSGRSTPRHIPFHRRLVQPAPAAFVARFWGGFREIPHSKYALTAHWVPSVVFWLYPL